MKWVRPWLHRTHRNFFIAYTATIIRFVTAAWVRFVVPHSFTGPAYAYVNHAAQPAVWGAVDVAIAAVLIVGLFRPTFRLARYGLGAACAVALFQLVLIAQASLDGAATGVGVPNYLFIAGAILAQTLEPPVNPATNGYRN